MPGDEFDHDHQMRDKLLGLAVERLASATTLDAIVAVVRSSARAVCSADGVTFVLRDGNECHYVEEDAIAPLWKGRRFPMGTCVSGWCMIHGQTAVIEDVFADPRIPHDVYRSTFVKSLIMTPVGMGTAVAAIGLYWASVRSFSAWDMRCVEDLAVAVGGAMNAVCAA